MSRRERKESPVGFYHVMQRGAGKQILFEDENDYLRYLRKIAECKEDSGVELVAYCLMNNHVHLLLNVEDVKRLSSFMIKIGTSYARWYNIKYNHAGYVFQGRFTSEPIGDESYLLSCVRYIHNNPVKAGLGARDEYRWSSYNEYYGQKYYVDSEFVESLIGNRAQFEVFSASSDNCKFMDDENNVVTCSVGKEIVQKHFGNEFENTMAVKQLCVKERNMIIKEMKAAGLSNHQIELITGISRDLVRRIGTIKDN